MSHIFLKIVCSSLAALLASLWKAESQNIVPGQIGFPSVCAVRGTCSKGRLHRAHESRIIRAVKNNCIFLRKQPLGFPVGHALAVSLVGPTPADLPLNFPCLGT